MLPPPVWIDPNGIKHLPAVFCFLLSSRGNAAFRIPIPNETEADHTLVREGGGIQLMGWDSVGVLSGIGTILRQKKSFQIEIHVF